MPGEHLQLRHQPDLARTAHDEWAVAGCARQRDVGDAHMHKGVAGPTLKRLEMLWLQALRAAALAAARASWASWYKSRLRPPSSRPTNVSPALPSHQVEL